LYKAITTIKGAVRNHKKSLGQTNFILGAEKYAVNTS